jgi:glycosyltransferase involved in cell wall biosynthesis
MSAPFFSIVIPLFNRRHLIDRAVNSVISQNYTDWELIIVDDHSTDGSWEHIQTYSHPRIRIFKNERNSERCVTRNRGVAEAIGRYIGFLDSDDHHLPDHLSHLHQLIEKQGYPKGFFFTNAWDEDEKGPSHRAQLP